MKQLNDQKRRWKYKCMYLETNLTWDGVSNEFNTFVTDVDTVVFLSEFDSKEFQMFLYQIPWYLSARCPIKDKHGHIIGMEEYKTETACNVTRDTWKNNLLIHENGKLISRKRGILNDKDLQWVLLANHTQCNPWVRRQVNAAKKQKIDHLYIVLSVGDGSHSATGVLHFSNLSEIPKAEIYFAKDLEYAMHYIFHDYRKIQPIDVEERLRHRVEHMHCLDNLIDDHFVPDNKIREIREEINARGKKAGK